MKPEWAQWKDRSRVIWAAIPLMFFGALMILSEFENPAGYMPMTIARFVLGTTLGIGGVSVFVFGLFCRWKYKKSYRDALPRP